jgi:hypothetical protein
MRSELIHEAIREFPRDGALPAHRLVRLAAGVLALSGASDLDALGATVGDYPAAVPLTPSVARVAMRSAASTYLVEASGAVMPGVVYQAASGKVASSGTVVAGVAVTGGTDVPVEIMPR